MKRDRITARLDEVYAVLDSRLDRGLEELQLRTLMPDEPPRERPGGKPTPTHR